MIRRIVTLSRSRISLFIRIEVEQSCLDRFDDFIRIVGFDIIRSVWNNDIIFEVDESTINGAVRNFEIGVIHPVLGIFVF